jgi:hypothetical protein
MKKSRANEQKEKDEKVNTLQMRKYGKNWNWQANNHKSCVHLWKWHPSFQHLLGLLVAWLSLLKS